LGEERHDEMTLDGTLHEKVAQVLQGKRLLLREKLANSI